MTQPFDIVVADPPWKFSSNSVEKPGRNAMRHYPCMSDQEISLIPVRDWVAPAALLFLWTTSPMLVRSLPVLNAWGFNYVSQLVWIKDHVGTGFWVRNRHEIVLVAKRGKFPCPKPAPFKDSVIIGQQREHSRKPEELQNRIDDVWPHTQRLEMFARRARPEWTVWGNQIDKFTIEGPP